MAEIGSKQFSPSVLCTQLAEHVFFCVPVLRLVHGEVLRFNAGHGQSGRVPCDFGKLDGTAFWTLHHLSLYKCEES